MKLFVSLHKTLNVHYFQTRFLEEADKFISELDEKTIKKIFYNIDLAEQTNDPKLFKKIQNEIWEFRTLYNKIAYRLFAFWDETEKSMIVATHGIVKKTDKTPKKEIEKAKQLRIEYLKSKKK